MEIYRSALAAHAGRVIPSAVRGKVDVSDVLQETAIEVHQQVGGFEGTSGAGFLAWACQILRFKASNMARHYLGTAAHDVRREVSLGSVGAGSSGVAPEPAAVGMPTPSRAAMERELREALAAALATLGERDRQVIEWRHRDELTFPQIAERLRTSSDNAAKIWARAVERLQRKLARQHGGPGAVSR
jgi:RNA polymerase sigma-70 factor (subfamily 1)